MIVGDGRGGYTADGGCIGDGTYVIMQESNINVL